MWAAGRCLRGTCGCLLVLGGTCKACNTALTKLDATTSTRLYHSVHCGADADIDVGADGGGSIIGH